MGQFTQRDPIGLAGGVNQYGYAGGDPVNFSDPFGLCITSTSARVCLAAMTRVGTAVSATVQTAVVGAIATTSAALSSASQLGAAILQDHAAAVADWVSDGLHANSIGSSKPAIGYSLRDRETGTVVKYGETTQGSRRYSASYLRRENLEFVAEASGTKREMRDWETEQIRAHREQTGERPRGNKSDHD